MKRQRGNTGIGFFGLLGLIFIGLKLAGIAPVATWSWWLVLLPVYGGIVVVFVLMLLALAIAGAVNAGSRRR